jgi:hypothetical protein
VEQLHQRDKVMQVVPLLLVQVVLAVAVAQVLLV